MDLMDLQVHQVQVDLQVHQVQVDHLVLQVQVDLQGQVEPLE